LHISQAVILAGGKGSRLGEKSKNCPKPLQEINGEPFLDYLIWNLKRYGIKKIILSVGYLGDQIISRYKNGYKFGVEIIYIKETKPLGTGGALFLCKEKLDEHFFLINGDTIFDINYHELGYKLLNKQATGVLGVNFSQNANRYGSVTIKKDLVLSFEEKSFKKNCYINGGVLAFRKNIFDFLDKETLSLEIDVLPKLVSRGLLQAVKFNNFFIDIGIPETLNDAQKLLPKWKNKGVILLDRDGVLNIDYGYVCTRKRFKFVEGAVNSIKLFNRLGLLVIVITNQSGIGRGFFNEEKFNKFMEWINNELKSQGAHLDDWFYCPHHPIEAKGKYKKDCDCRKPKSGLIKSAIKTWKFDKEKAILIGDKESDLNAAKNLNIKSYKFDHNNERLDTFVKKLQLDNLQE